MNNPTAHEEIKHDIKNALAAINANAQLLFMHAKNQDVAGSLVLSSTESIEAQVSIASELLDKLR